MDRRVFLGTAAASAAILAGGGQAIAETETHYPYTTWWLHRRPRDYLAEPGITLASEPNDLDLVRKLLSEYRQTFRIAHYGDGMWRAIFERRHGALHKAFMTGTAGSAVKLLRDPSSNELHFGFDDTRLGITRTLASSDKERTRLATICKMHLVTLGEALGVERIENPESIPVERKGPPTDALLHAVERGLGMQVDFPNPFPNEYGLATDRGVASVRAIQALYQAYRIRAIVAAVNKPRILEIGAGTGRTAYYCYRMGIRDYSIVDLPFTGISQGYFLGRTLGERTVILEGERVNQDGIKLLSPDSFFAQRTRYDLIVNVDSLTEIPNPIAERYWQAIKSRAARFLSINHEANEHTVMETTATTPASRFPYWMRRGYAEELYVL